jgi:hypothetical protein
MQNLFRTLCHVDRLDPSAGLCHVSNAASELLFMFYEERCRGVSFLTDRFLLATPVIGCQHAMMSCVKAAATRLSQLQQYFGRNRNRRSGALDIDYISVGFGSCHVATWATARITFRDRSFRDEMDPFDEQWHGVRLREQGNYGARARAVMEWRPIRQNPPPKFQVCRALCSRNGFFHYLASLHVNQDGLCRIRADATSAMA